MHPFETAVDELIGEFRHLKIANISWAIGTSNVFHDCYGDWDEDEAANQLYESGTLPIKSSGNDGLNGCNISVPGSAVGAFTVGGTGDRYSAPNVVDQVAQGPIFTGGSGGGENGRTIVDLVAPAYRRNLFGFVTNGAGSYSSSHKGTSYSTPTVAAAAVNFMDFYRTHYSTWIDSPGPLFASMLLMGDRTYKNPSSSQITKLSSRYHDDWGAGRMLMRKFDSSGMDTPWSYGRYGVCVPDGNVVEFSLGSISSDVEGLKVVLYWYDRRHDSYQTLDDLDLKVQYKNAGVSVTRYSSASYENKERIFVDPEF